MNSKPAWLLGFALALLPLATPAQNAAFTYQGVLAEGGQPAHGNYDLRFALADDVAEGDYLGPKLTRSGVAVTNGVFSVTLDFGSQVFDGSARWLEIEVRKQGQAAFTLLSPRQALNATPYAILAAKATTAEVASGLAAGAVITGDGSGITNLNGSSIQSQTISSNQIEAVTDALYRKGGGIPTLNGSGTNLTVFDGLTLVGAGSVRISVEDERTVVPQSDTNSIVVSGAGAPAATGAYAYAGASGIAVDYYTNASGCGLVFDFGEETAFGVEAPIYITNAAGIVYLDDAQYGLRGRWYQGPAGAWPVPQVAYGAKTNQQAALSIQGSPLLARATSTNTLFVNSQIGDDQSAQVGRADRPWASMDAAVLSATPGSTLELGPGIFYITNELVLKNAKLSLVGAGRRRTTIRRQPGSEMSLWIGANSVLSDFTTDLGIGVTGTNSLVANVESVGVVDDLLVFAGGVRIENSSFASGFDSAVIDPGAGSRPVAIVNCSFDSVWDGHSVDCRGLAVKSGTCEITGGTIRVRNSSNPVCVATTTDSPNIRVTLNNVAFDYATTNGTAWAVSNAANVATITLLSGSIPRSAVRGNLVYAEGTFGNGLTTNVIISGAKFYITNGVIMKFE